jgi:polar amino acid transport system substrate-binding protein
LKKSHVLLLALVVLALVLVPIVAGCGSSTATTTSTAAAVTTTTAAAPAETTTTAAAGGETTTTAAAAAYDIKAITAAIKADPAITAMLPAGNQKDGVIVASDIPYMPWEGFVGDTEQPTGFDYDLSQALAAKLGVPFKFTKVAFDSIILGIQAKKYDVSMSDMYDNAERQKVLDFVDYAEDTTAIITLNGNPKNITSLDSLAGLQVGCEKGTTQAAMLDQLNTSGKTKMTVKQFPGQADALLALQAGTIDCDVTDRSTAFYNADTTVKNGQKVFQLAVDPANPDGYAPTPVGMGVLKANTQLRDALQKALQALIDDGTLKTIAAHWGPVAVTSSQINQGK